jgi:hypothetical protein
VVLVDVVGWMLGMTAAMVWAWFLRKSTARAEVGRWVQRGGLPAEPELVEVAQTWFQRRQATLVVGVWIGMMVGGIVLLIAGVGLDPAFLAWWFAAVILGGGIVTCVRSYRAVRKGRADGPRAAALRPRRLTDYLSTFEIWVQYGLIAVPLLAAALGLLALGSGGWVLVVGGLVAVPMTAAAFYLQRLSLQVSQPAGGEAELQWQKAFRAATLRDLGMVGICISWLLGAAAALSFDWPADVPGFVPPATYVLFLGSTVLIVASTVVSVSKLGLRRVVAA